MDYGIFDILSLLGSLVLFLYGMKLMSESLQKVAGDRMRSILAAMTSNRFKGVLTGVLITAIIQSSSATTVMLVSFVNAGLISLVESIGVIMGANIGTTITAWLISILGFKVKISTLVIPLMGLALPLVFSKKRSLSNWGGVIIGFAIIFIGLDFLKGATPDIKSNPEMLEFLKNFSNWGYGSLLIYLLIGTLLTVVIQSSSAVMALTLVMCFNGWLTYEMAAAMVLGENIGTTITANLAALIGNTSARRTARAHLIFNVLGVVIVMIFFYPFLKMVAGITEMVGFDSPLGGVKETFPVGLSIFHTTFNILLTSLLIWFVPLIAKIVVWMVPDKVDDEEFRLQHISTGMLSTSELSILQAKKESFMYAQRVDKMFGYTKDLVCCTNAKDKEKLITKIKKYEDISDRMEEEIALYSTKIGESSISEHASDEINKILSVITKLENIADSCHEIAKTVERQMEKKVVLSDEMITNFNSIIELVEKQIGFFIEQMSHQEPVERNPEWEELDCQLRKLLKKLQSIHFKSLKKGTYKTKDGIIYSDVYRMLGNIGFLAFELNKALPGEDQDDD
jgi:phosphate:Na+ symporter